MKNKTNTPVASSIVTVIEFNSEKSEMVLKQFAYDSEGAPIDPSVPRIQTFNLAVIPPDMAMSIICSIINPQKNGNR